MKISTLKRKAGATAQCRGHKMIWSEVYRSPYGFGGDCQDGSCLLCGDVVQLTENPPPNGIDIEGTAMSRNCRYKNLMPNERAKK